MPAHASPSAPDSPRRGCGGGGSAGEASVLGVAEVRAESTAGQGEGPAVGMRRASRQSAETPYVTASNAKALAMLERAMKRAAGNGPRRKPTLRLTVVSALAEANS